MTAEHGFTGLRSTAPAEYLAAILRTALNRAGRSATVGVDEGCVVVPAGPGPDGCSRPLRLPGRVAGSGSRVSGQPGVPRAVPRNEARNSGAGRLCSADEPAEFGGGKPSFSARGVLPHAGPSVSCVTSTSPEAGLRGGPARALVPRWRCAAPTSNAADRARSAVLAAKGHILLRPPAVRPDAITRWLCRVRPNLASSLVRACSRPRRLRLDPDWVTAGRA